MATIPIDLLKIDDVELQGIGTLTMGDDLPRLRSWRLSFTVAKGHYRQGILGASQKINARGTKRWYEGDAFLVSSRADFKGWLEFRGNGALAEVAA